MKKLKMTKKKRKERNRREKEVVAKRLLERLDRRKARREETNLQKRGRHPNKQPSSRLPFNPG